MQGAGPTTGAFPDSTTAACTDGKALITCPCPPAPTFGQDGNYRSRPPSYTVGTATITDAVTGLVWERTPPTTPDVWSDADARCSALTIDGGGFRLPTRYELLTLADTGAEPSIDTATFGTDPGLYTYAWWSSTPLASGTNEHWVMIFVSGGAPQTQPNNAAATSRCVKGTTPAATYAATPATVLDERTGLMWQRVIDTSFSGDWLQALAHCQALSAGGHDDWRLPSSKELFSLVDDSRATAPLVDTTMFADTPLWEHWTSTPMPGSPDVAMTVSLASGMGGNTQIKFLSGAAIRCVR